jgi:glycosyltransferase involved in cell wall biosynthesis
MLKRVHENRVAILLSTFNGERFLPAQLQSLLDQSFDEWTLYWRDDGSSDHSVAIVEEFARTAGQGRCVQLQITPERLRPAASYLALLAAVRERLGPGDMVAFADQDDVWLPQKLARGVEALRRRGPEAPALYCARQVLVDEALNPLGQSLRITRPPAFPAALIQNVTTGCTLLLNRPAANLIAASTPPPASVHDWWCYLVVTGAGGTLVADDEATVLYRQHPANLIGGHASMPRRALAALRRGRRVYMDVLRQHVGALMAQPHLLAAGARAQVMALDRALRGNLWQRVRVLFTPGLHRQTMPERAGFWLWFLLG